MNCDICKNQLDDHFYVYYVDANRKSTKMNFHYKCFDEMIYLDFFIAKHFDVETFYKQKLCYNICGHEFILKNYKMKTSVNGKIVKNFYLEYLTD